MQIPSQAAVSLFRRTRDFLVRTQPQVALADIKQHIEALSGIADRLSSQAIEQDTRSRQGRAGTARLRQVTRTLRLEYLRPMHRASRALFKGDETILAAFRFPARLRRPEALVSVAHGMANAALPHKERFLAVGFAPDFVERVRNAAAQVLDAVDKRATDLARRSASRSALLAEVSSGYALMSLLDAMIGPRIEGSEELAAEWRSLMRQGRREKGVEALAVIPVRATSGSVPDATGASEGGGKEVDRAA